MAFLHNFIARYDEGGDELGDELGDWTISEELTFETEHSSLHGQNSSGLGSTPDKESGPLKRDEIAQRMWLDYIEEQV